MEMGHLTVSMDIPAVPFVHRVDPRELVESLIQINPRQAQGIGYGRRDPRELAS
jgi:hypothetical protein